MRPSYVCVVFHETTSFSEQDTMAFPHLRENRWPCRENFSWFPMDFPRAESASQAMEVPHLCSAPVRRLPRQGSKHHESVIGFFSPFLTKRYFFWVVLKGVEDLNHDFWGFSHFWPRYIVNTLIHLINGGWLMTFDPPNRLAPRCSSAVWAKDSQKHPNLPPLLPGVYQSVVEWVLRATTSRVLNPAQTRAKQEESPGGSQGQWFAFMVWELNVHLPQSRCSKFRTAYTY